MLLPLAGLFVGLGPVTITMYAPSMPALALEFATTEAMIQKTVMVYLAAFALTQLVLGPISDRFGRRPIILFGMTVYAVGSLLAALSTGIEMLLLARFVQAVGACAGPVAGRAMVRDCYEGQAAAKAMTVIATIVTLGPAAGPLVGGYLQAFFGWSSVFMFMSVVGLICLAAGLFVLPETHRNKNPDALNPKAMARSYRTLLTTPTYLGYCAAVMTALAGILAYGSYAPFVLINQVGLSPEGYGWFALVPALCFLLGAQIARVALPSLGVRNTTLIGCITTLAAGAALAGLMLSDVVGILPILLPVMLWVIGMALALPAGMAGALQPFPQMAGAASALMGFMQMGGSAVGTLGAAMLNNGTAHHLGTVPLILAIIGTLGMVLLTRAEPAGRVEP